MGASNYTPLGFNQWIGTDKPLREDFNADNALADLELSRLDKKIDDMGVPDNVAIKDGALQTNLNAELLNGNNQFEYYNFKGGKFLSQGADCNTLPLGITWTTSSTVSNTILNRPSGISGSARIITETANGNPDANYAVQTWLSRANDRLFQRTSTAGVWGTWREVALMETGAWTPVIKGLTVAGTNTYSAQVGEFVKIGKTVDIFGQLILSQKDSLMSGVIAITGFPFVAVSTPASLRPTAFITYMQNVTFPANTALISAGIDPSVNAIRFVATRSGTTLTELRDDALVNNSAIMFTARYITN